jgi:hypothetical protein
VPTTEGGETLLVVIAVEEDNGGVTEEVLCRALGSENKVVFPSIGDTDTSFPNFGVPRALLNVIRS